MLSPYYVVVFIDGEGCFSSVSTKMAVLPMVVTQAKKRLQFEKFCQVAELIKVKQHLTPGGIERIRALKHEDSLDALDAHVQWGATEIT
jgi:hypothetical protein